MASYTVNYLIGLISFSIWIWILLVVRHILHIRRQELRVLESMKQDIDLMKSELKDLQNNQ